MSHFSSALNELIRKKPHMSFEEWGRKFDIYPAHLAMMAQGGGALNHRTIAKIASHLAPGEREKLIVAFLLDEGAAIESEAAVILNGKIDWAISSLIRHGTKDH